MRLLVVEDDDKIATLVVKGFKEHAFVVDRAADGKEGLHLATTRPYDAAVVDIMLPKRDGLGLIEDLRRRSVTLPIVILSAKSSLDDRIKGLQRGGDDYLVKPFAFAELLARVEALIRRSSRVVEPARLAAGDLTLNLLTRKATRAGVEIDLQAREFSLLEYLMRHAGRVLSKTMLLEHVWGYDFDPQTNVVDVLVCRLRNKVDRESSARLIHTVRGVGYVLKN
jgi:two-component system OmpR family response regulator